MARTYDSSRRAQAAERTREAIVAAAFRLHGMGRLDLEELAAEADVSLATVRKHFPTREQLFEGCTNYGIHLVPPPDFDAIAAEQDPAARMRLVVQQVYAFNEALCGQIWTGLKLEDESPVLRRVFAENEALLEAVADLALQPWHLPAEDVADGRGFIVGMLNPLTHRALRKYGGLSPEQAVEHTAGALVRALVACTGRRREEVAHT